MLEEARTKAEAVFPRGRKFYVFLAFCYGLGAISDLSRLFLGNHGFSHLSGHWTVLEKITGWVGIVAMVFCIWLFVEIFSAVSNPMEKVICVLTMIYFALGIPISLRSLLGYSLVGVRQCEWISAIAMTLAALLMFLRTFQVLYHREA